MQIRTTLAAIALSLAPGIALAQGCHSDQIKDDTASSCAPGATWDSARSACVANPTS